MSSAVLHTLHDPYPSRLDHAISPIERRDPTVWCDRTGASGPLSPGDLERFDERGYLIRPDTIGTEAVGPIGTEIERLAADLAPGDRRLIREPGGAIRSIFAPHLLSGLIADVVRSDAVLPIARQLLGGDVYIHQARINLMPGFTGSGFYWHSDFETWHAEDGMPRMRAVSCSIALTPNYPYNGSLMVIPGSHHTFYPCVGATPDNHHEKSLVAQQFGVPDCDTLTKAVDARGIDQFTGAAGSALWFDCNLLHGSGSNITPLPRSNVFLVFNSVQNRLAAPYSAQRCRPEHLAARTATAPIRR
ncbi:ectoine hydroxylase [Mycolicibacterium sp. A43C]